MKTTLRNTLACLAWSLPLAAFAQTAPAPVGSSGMDMSAMPDMAPHADGHAKPASHAGHATGAPNAAPAMPAPAGSAGMAMEGMDMSGMENHGEHASHGAASTPSRPSDPAAAKPSPLDSCLRRSDEPNGECGDRDDTSMEHGQSHDMHDMGDMGGTHDMHDMRMQGGAAPADARSADYSDGIGYGDMSGMHMLDAEPLGMLRFDRLEAFHGDHGNGQAWELNGWYGTDLDKLWLRSEGEREGGQSEGDVEALWSHAVAPYWDTQLGVRHDFGGGPSRQWLAFGVQGLAPYWFELEATAYLGANGRSAARLRAEYELLLTQRLILQPELEANLYGKADPARRIGSGLSDASFGLRLRYEFGRQFAPYLGVVWTRRFGGTAGFAREEHQAVFDRQVVAGFRIWF